MAAEAGRRRREQEDTVRAAVWRVWSLELVSVGDRLWHGRYEEPAHHPLSHFCSSSCDPFVTHCELPQTWSASCSSSRPDQASCPLLQLPCRTPFDSRCRRRCRTRRGRCACGPLPASSIRCHESRGRRMFYLVYSLPNTPAQVSEHLELACGVAPRCFLRLRTQPT